MKYLLVSALFIGVLTSCGSEEKKPEKKEPIDTTAKVEARKMGELKIAYYYQDSMAVNFDYYRIADSTIKVEQINFEKEVARREQDYVNWAQAKDQQAQQGLISENDMIRLQEEAQAKQAQLAQYQQTKGAELESKYLKEMESIIAKIEKFSTDYCEANNIDMLIKRGTGGQFGYIHSSMDVTEEFVEYLNQAQEELITGK